MGNYAFRKWKVTHWVFYFLLFRKLYGFFSFMLKVLFPVATFSNLVMLQSASTSAHERETEKKTKKDKNNHGDEILSRIADLEKATESVESLKEKVRGLPLQKSPNEVMLLLLLEELTNVARKRKHDDANVFEELSRQALKHQRSINLAVLVLNVVGGGLQILLLRLLTNV